MYLFYFQKIFILKNNSLRTFSQIFIEIQAVEKKLQRS